VIARVPEDVIGDPAMENTDGTEAATEVTVPVPGAAGACHVGTPATTVRTVLLAPTVARPVPPEVAASGVELSVREDAIIAPETVKGDVKVAAVDVLL
jgi:hypothetical protein